MSRPGLAALGATLLAYCLWFVPAVLGAIHDGGRRAFCLDTAERIPDLLPQCEAMRSAAALSGLGGAVWLGAVAGALGLYRLVRSQARASGKPG